jgi:hypothetical protein
MNDSLRDKIAQQIRESFSSTPYPGDHNIAGDDPFDGVLVEEAFRGKHWHDITLELLLKHHSKLPFVSPAAYRFYLPAYILGVLYHFEDLDLMDAPYLLLTTLTPSYPTSLPRFLEVAKHFTPEERAAIHSFLSNCKELFPEERWGYLFNQEEELNAAIEYWK